MFRALSNHTKAKKTWDAPSYWQRMETTPAPRFPATGHNRRLLRRWLRDTGIL
jgi:hypothetical protein